MTVNDHTTKIFSKQRVKHDTRRATLIKKILQKGFDFPNVLVILERFSPTCPRTFLNIFGCRGPAAGQQKKFRSWAVLKIFQDGEDIFFVPRRASMVRS